MTESKTTISRLQQNPAIVVPKRVFLLSLAATAIIAGVCYLLGFDVLRTVAGYWVGIIACLVNFRLICMGISKAAAGPQEGVKRRFFGGYMTRQIISGLALLIGAFIGLPAMVASIIGVSMAKFAIQLDGFISYRG